MEALTEDADSLDTWIENVETEFLKIRKAVLTYRIQVNDDKLCSSHKRSVKTHEKNFNDVAKGIDEPMRQDCLVETLSNERSVLHSQFEKLKESYNNYVSVVSEDVSETLTYSKSPGL